MRSSETGQVSHSVEKPDDKVLDEAAELRAVISPEKQRAYDSLIQLGMLRRLSDIGPVYHGRARRGADDFLRVNDRYDNLVSRDGGNNINNEPVFFATPQWDAALGYADYGLARRQGRARTGESWRREIDRMTSDDPNAMVLMGDFDPSQLSPAEHRVYEQALAVTTGATSGSNETLPAAKRSEADEKAAKAARYATGAFVRDPRRTIYDALVRGKAHDRIDKSGKRIKGRPTSADRRTWLKNWLTDNHVVGVYDTKHKVKSEKLGDLVMHDGALYDQYVREGKEGRDYSWVTRRDKFGREQKKLFIKVPVMWFFNLNRTKSEEQLSEERQNRKRMMGRLALWSAQHLGTKDLGALKQPNTFRERLGDELIAGSPKRLVLAAMAVTGRNGGNYESTFAASTGNWEGYTLQQHTETVLRNFDNNYADKIPAKLLPLARLALVVHDIGKPEWADPESNNKRGDQEAYNQRTAFRFMKDAGIDKPTAIFVNRLLFGVKYRDQAGRERVLPALKDLAGEAYVVTKHTETHSDAPWLNETKGPNQEINTYQEAKLAEAARMAARSLFGDNFEPADIAGIMYLAMAVQASDAGAYTRYAMTDWGDGRYVRNAGTFNKSFVGAPTDHAQVHYYPRAIYNYNKASDELGAQSMP